MSRLLLSENKIISEALNNKIPIKLIRPTLIYGDYVNNEDKNISKIIKIMSKYLYPFPF